MSQVVTWPRGLAFQLASAGLFKRETFVHSIFFTKDSHALQNYMHLLYL